MLPEPAISRDDAKGLWRVDEELVVLTRGFRLVIPNGFETDLASVPRVLWLIIAPFELSCIAPIVHDYLYQHGGAIDIDAPWRSTTVRQRRVFTKDDADSFFLDLMTQEGISPWRRLSAYYAVHFFGQSSWQSLKETV